LAEQALARRKPPTFASSSPTSFVAVKVHFGRKPAGIGVLAALQHTSCVPQRFLDVIRLISIAYVIGMKLRLPD
jgi:hypothetical protein